MLELRCIEQLALCIQILKYQRICIFYEFSGIRGLCGQITLAVYELYEGQLVITSDTAVVFTESRCDMNDTGTICQCYVSITNNIKCFFVLFFCMNGCTAVQWFVLFIFQVCSFVILSTL